MISIKRIAIDLGLHRQTTAMDKLGYDVEMRKRLFWSCYTMDRQVSIPLGRPFAISDQDIDVQLPLDVDEPCQDIEALEKASKVDPEVVRTSSTSLTAFLHILRLRRIESSIQQAIYRVDRSVNATDADIKFYLDQLECWKNLIPLDARKKIDRESIPFDGYDYYGKLKDSTSLKPSIALMEPSMFCSFVDYSRLHRARTERTCWGLWL